MAINLERAMELIDLCRARGLRGKLLSLGKQDLNFSFLELAHEMAQRGLISFDGSAAHVSDEQKAVLDELLEAGRILSNKADRANRGFLSDEFFFRFIGFDVVRSVDYSSFEGADYEFDLNNAGLADVAGTYDVVYDGGTMEHVFHIPNVMRNMFETLETGGTALHHSPTNNFVDHGFYQFSPTFFFDYYTANGYADVDVRVRRAMDGRSSSAEYEPGSFAKLVNTLDAGVYGTECAARKTPQSTCDRIPQQGAYKRTWTSSPS